jgi:DNA-binding LacI/PurR family transcriptional regulator
VARAAGVSQSTVSYVLTGKRPISEETSRRVRAAMDRLTYHPNAGARALASQRTSVIGLVVPFGAGTDTAGLLPFIETIAAMARAREHEVLLVTSNEGSAGLRRLAGRSLCDAIVVMDVQAVDERVPVAASLHIPVILIGVPRDRAGLPCVDLDYARAGELAVEELADTGHDRLVLIGHSAERRDLNFVRRFLAAAQRAARRRGLPIELVAPVEPGRAAARQAVARALEGHGRERLGVIIPNSQAVQPVLHALAARGVRPGRDVSVIGLCPDRDAEDMEPPVTNISNEPRDVSRRAMETIFRLLDAGEPAPLPGVELLAPRLTRRSTVMPPRPARRPRSARRVGTSSIRKQQAPGRSPRPGIIATAAGGGALRRDHE